MSRAFVRESDQPEDDATSHIRPQLPPGVPNHMTPDGAEHLRNRLALLLEEKRKLSEAAENRGIAEVELRLRKLESRIRLLQQILDSAVIAKTGPANRDRVCFGALVGVRHANG